MGKPCRILWGEFCSALGSGGEKNVNPISKKREQGNSTEDRKILVKEKCGPLGEQKAREGEGGEDSRER